MKIEMGTTDPATIRDLLNDAREDANNLRARLRVMSRVVMSSRMVMGHEIKKPTTALSGYLDLALDELNNGSIEELETHLRKARRECDLLKELSLFFLELLKIHHGDEILRGSKVNLKEFVFEVFDHAPANLKVKERVRTRISPNIRDFRINEDVFKIILSNVVENALRYSPEDTEVLLDIRRDPEKRRMRQINLLKIIVSDHGPGIPPAYLKKIFAPFVRLREDVTEGTGLGLTLVRSLVELYDGNVFIKSSSEEGTTVNVTIPEMEDWPEGGHDS